ncbi:MAG: hypothetical protein KF855_03395 [Acidobacteria bacterium]|nr:hypothetical protein [Acidobacteriota bacterium]
MRHPLPRKEEGFDKALEDIYRVEGKPFFRCVNGQTETHWCNGNPHSIKHWEIDEVNGGRIGRGCWVIEVFQRPSELDRAEWESTRHHYLERNGIERLVDWRGPFPRNGRYIWFQDLVDGNEQPIRPTLKVVEAIKLSFLEYQSKWKKNAAEEVEGFYDNEEKDADERAVRYADNFYQAHGLAARSAFHKVEVGRPIIARTER